MIWTVKTKVEGIFHLKNDLDIDIVCCGMSILDFLDMVF